MAPTELPFFIALAGPTASGKTAAALAVAQHHPVEIVSVDSALVFRGMDIGTAKPTAEEMASVPHHLINIRDPLHAYSAAHFVSDAQNLLQDITARGKLPLLVGGTMLYFKALLDGLLGAMPMADAVLREALAQEARQLGWPALHAQLAQVDPATAARLAPHDGQRIQRALEVYRLTGLPLSEFHAAHAAARATAPSQARYALISLEPQDRAWLHARIAQRFEAMLAQGFLDEVQALRARGDLHLDLPSMRCVGYRQAWELLDAHAAAAPDSPFPIARLRELGIYATRQLAKRQITWLRSMPQRHTIACDSQDACAQVLHAVGKHLTH